MAEGVLPIGIEAALAEGENAGGEIGQVPLGQDEKTAVIGDQLEAVILKAEGPSDPAISRGTFPGGSGEAEEGDPLITPEGHVPEGFANFGQGPQVMMSLH